MTIVLQVIESCFQVRMNRIKRNQEIKSQVFLTHTLPYYSSSRPSSPTKSYFRALSLSLLFASLTTHSIVHETVQVKSSKKITGPGVAVINRRHLFVWSSYRLSKHSDGRSTQSLL